MNIVENLFRLFPRLLQVALSCEPFMFLVIVLFIVVIVTNIICYFIWGRY